MRPESPASTLANMSAPPFSTVTLPRLTPSAHCDGSAIGACADLQHPRAVPVGPGGGELLSHALCVAFVALPKAVCAYLDMGFASPLLTEPLGLARALLAIARQASQVNGPQAPSRAAQLEFARVMPMSEGALIQELAARLESLRWPNWVPPVAFVTPLAMDIADGVCGASPPAAPTGVRCPLLAARLVSAIREPVFLRDAAPALSNLLNLWGGTAPSGIWEIWLPIRPGQAKPMPVGTPATTGENS